MVTDAEWNNRKQDDFTRYMNTAVEVFGTERIPFGSDWRVCLTAASYKEVIGIAADYFKQFTINEQSLFWGENAKRFYNL